MKLIVMGPEGHRELAVTTDTLADVQVEFDGLMAQGYSAFEKGLDGESKRVTALNPGAEETVVFRQLVGG